MHGYWLNKQAIEDMAQNTKYGKLCAIIRPAHFLQNFMPPVRNFRFPNLVNERTIHTTWEPTTKIPWVDASDVGLVVAASLSDLGKGSSVSDLSNTAQREIVAVDRVASLPPS